MIHSSGCTAALAKSFRALLAGHSCARPQADPSVTGTRLSTKGRDLLPLGRGGFPRPERGEAGEELVAFHLKKLLGLGEPSQAMAAEAAEADAGW